MQDRLRTDESVRVVGHRWSAPSHEVKDFLTRNQVPFRWLELERDAEAARLLDASGGDAEHLPLVITDTGQTLQAPTTLEVASALGLSSTPSLPFYDLIVIGGGPAGLGAAVLRGVGRLRTVLVEREAIGGQAGQSSRIENYLGFPSGIGGSRPGLEGQQPGPPLRGGDAAHLRGFRPRGVRFGASRPSRSGHPLSAHAVLLTTGVAVSPVARSRASTPSPEPASTTGPPTTEAQSCEGEDVYIVGGANSAGQAAVFFARTARSVTIMVRGQSLARSMSHYLIEQIAGLPNVRVRTCSEVVGASGSDHLERLRIADRDAGTEEEVETSWLFVFIGAAPGPIGWGKRSGAMRTGLW